MTATAQSVSARLRRAGFRPVSPSDYRREGLKVRSAFYGCTVHADLDSSAAARLLADDAESALRDLGYKIRRCSPIMLTVEP